MPVSADHEPAERDPKKLRRTAWVLLVIMLLGGTLVMTAYNKWASSQAKDTRPAVIYRITKERDLRIARQDGKQANLFDLRGHVIALNLVSIRHPESSQRSAAVMKRLSEAYAPNGDFNLVTLVLDEMPAETMVGELGHVAESGAMRLPQWWVGSNESATLQKFVRNELKPSVPPDLIDGKWQFDPSVILIDKNGHLRRAVVPIKNGVGSPKIIAFDFDQAAKWDAEGRKSGSDLSNEAEMEKLLYRTIDALLAEPFVK